MFYFNPATVTGSIDFIKFATGTPNRMTMTNNRATSKSVGGATSIITNWTDVTPINSYLNNNVTK